MAKISISPMPEKKIYIYCHYSFRLALHILARSLQMSVSANNSYFLNLLYFTLKTTQQLLYRVYKKRLNRSEIALNF